MGAEKPYIGCFIGGASKSGTTALYYYLRQHPEMFVSEKKELHYFSRPELMARCAGPGDKYVVEEVPRTVEEYLAYYQDAGAAQKCLDISPSYLYYSSSASRIRSRFPDAKMVFILRNPADKAFSQYAHLRSTCRESLTFEEALLEEGNRARAGYSDMWAYRDSGYYADRVAEFMGAFGRDNVRIYLFEEFTRSPLTVVRDVCEFFGVSSDMKFVDPGRVNASGEPRSRVVAEMFLQPNKFTHVLRRMLPASVGRWCREALRNLNAGKKLKLSESVRSELLQGYVHDIQRLETMMGRKTGWLA